MRVNERKLWASGVSLLSIIGGFLTCGFLPAVIPVFSTYCATVTTIAATYLVGNVASKAFPPKVEV